MYALLFVDPQWKVIVGLNLLDSNIVEYIADVEFISYITNQKCEVVRGFVSDIIPDDLDLDQLSHAYDMYVYRGPKNFARRPYFSLTITDSEGNIVNSPLIVNTPYTFTIKYEDPDNLGWFDAFGGVVKLKDRMNFVALRTEVTLSPDTKSFSFQLTAPSAGLMRLRVKDVLYCCYTSVFDIVFSNVVTLL